jgi:hypothetical protein
MYGSLEVREVICRCHVTQKRRRSAGLAATPRLIGVFEPLEELYNPDRRRQGLPPRFGFLRCDSLLAGPCRTAPAFAPPRDLDRAAGLLTRAAAAPQRPPARRHMYRRSRQPGSSTVRMVTVLEGR